MQYKIFSGEFFFQNFVETQKHMKRPETKNKVNETGLTEMLNIKKFHEML